MDHALMMQALTQGAQGLPPARWRCGTGADPDGGRGGGG